MRLLKRKDDKRNRGGTAVADQPTEGQEVYGSPEEFNGTTPELFAEIERLTAANQTTRSHANDRRLLRLRHLAGIRLLDEAATGAKHPEPAFDRLPDSDGLPEIDAEDVTPELIRAGMLRDGCLLVRGLFPRDAALRFADQIDRSFAERDKHDEGRQHAEGYYEEFLPHTRYGPVNARPWIKEGGGVLAADSPMLAFEMLELFRNGRVPELAAGYLGEPAAFSVHKTTLRKADPSIAGAWHQDGAFMGPVRALNLWVSLSRCGDESPGLDLVPRRLDELVRAQTDEAILDYQVSQRGAEEAAAAGGKTIIRPIFEPGDALFFDELFLHQTGSDPSMPKPRYAIENWFFGASAFPTDYAPIAV
jgi:hypothetical protein